MKYRLSILAMLLAMVGVSAAEPERPNIILYLSDDLGYADLACMGHPYAKTPNLDQLAQQGALFMQHYVTGVTCAPSRTGIMTGKHPASYPKYPGHYGYGDQQTITALLKENGYATGHFGKWHIGPDSTPGTYGIDEVNVKGKSEETEGRDDGLTQSALDFIEEHADGPFYVNIWGHSTHYPVKDYPQLAEEMGDFGFDRADFDDSIQSKFDESQQINPNLKESMKHYLADVYGVDKNVGLVLKKLDELGITENTIVVYSSDHGPAAVRLGAKKGRKFSEHMLGYASTLQGSKGNQWEGGVRVPFIIRWPSHVQAGRVDTESVTSFMDWLPTLCDITGIKNLPEGLGGENISDIWLQGPRERKTTLCWKTSSRNSEVSIRSGKWKYHRSGHENYTPSQTGPFLYDLSKDASERNNLADQYPEVTEKLARAADEWERSLPKKYEKNKDFKED